MSLASYFLSGAMAINASQFLGAPLQLINQDWYNTWIAWTKESFGLLTMTMTQWWAPTVVKVSGDNSMRGQLTQNADGTLRCLFPKRLVLIANHQIYTDWMYLWWIAYTNRMHGRLYIILKESLKSIPVLGWGMQMSQFIFMKRNWEQDKPNMQKHLAKLRRHNDPMWLMLFPEGTNLAPDTRDKSRAWARKTGVKDMQHVLLPRSTGLQFCLQELKGSMDYLYDCTIAYKGVGRGQYAQDVFSLKASYLEGKPPEAVHIYWRRFPISSIPLQDHDLFGKWLAARWREKDYLLEMWHRKGQFPADTGAEKLANGVIRRGCGHIESQVRPSQWYEFLQIFAPMGVLALVLSVFYGALPDWFMKAATKQAIQSDSVPVPQIQVNGAGKPISWLSFLDPDKQGGVVQQLLQKFVPSPSLALADAEAPEEIDRKVSIVKKNFFDKMEEEQASRKTALRSQKKVGSKPQVGSKPHVAFSDALKTEETKRRGSTISAPSAKRPTPNRPSPAQRSSAPFSDALKDEESKRKGSVVTTASIKTSATRPKLDQRPSVTFSQAVKDEEAKRRGSTVTASTRRLTSSALPKAGFQQSLKDEAARRKGSVTTNRSQALSTKTGASGTFRDGLKAEEAKNTGIAQPTKPTAAPRKPPSTVSTKSAAAKGTAAKPAAAIAAKPQKATSTTGSKAPPKLKNNSSTTATKKPNTPSEAGHPPKLGPAAAAATTNPVKKKPPKLAKKS